MIPTLWGGSRTATALAAVLLVLVVANVARSTVVPSGLHLGFNLATAGLVAAIGAWAQLSRTELGLESSTLGAGLRFGLAVFGIVLAAIGRASCRERVWIPV